MVEVHSDASGGAEEHDLAAPHLGQRHHLLGGVQPDEHHVRAAGQHPGPPHGPQLQDPLSALAWVPLYDRIIVPMARRFTGHLRGFTQLQRMDIGLVISIFAMLAAGILEVVRLRVVAEKGMLDSTDYMPISIFWQIPEYFIVGATEVFTFIGQLEFFYDPAPDAMRSMCTALSLTVAALGNYLCSLFVIIVTAISTKNGGPGWIPDNLNCGHLDHFFWLLAVLSAINFVIYLWIARQYSYKATEEAPLADMEQ